MALNTCLQILFCLILSSYGLGIVGKGNDASSLTKPNCAVYRVSEQALYFEGCFKDNKIPYFASLNDAEFKEIKIIPGGALAVLSELPRIEEGKNAQLIIQENVKQAKSPIEFVQYSELPKERVLPEFSRLAHDLRSGNITILNEKSFYVPNLYYDGLGPDAYFWAGKGTSGPDENGRKVANEKNSYGVIKKYTGQSIVITLPEDLTVHDIDYFGVWCIQYKHNFGYVDIPKNLKLSTHIFRKDDLKLNSKNDEQDGPSKLLPAESQDVLNSSPEAKVGCSVYQVSENALYLEECIKDNMRPIMSTFNGVQFKEMKFIPGGVLAVLPETPKVEASADAQLVIQENKGKSKLPFKPIQRSKLPKERVLPEFSRLAHGLRSGNITILNEKSFYVPDLYYDGLGPDAYFWAGNGANGPDENGRKVANEKDSYGVLKKYTGQSIVITLPKGLTVNNIDYFGVWCVEYKHNFGYVDIPKNLDLKRI